MFSLSGKVNSQIPCFPCAVATRNKLRKVSVYMTLCNHTTKFLYVPLARQREFKLAQIAANYAHGSYKNTVLSFVCNSGSSVPAESSPQLTITDQPFIFQVDTEPLSYSKTHLPLTCQTGQNSRIAFSFDDPHK